MKADSILDTIGNTPHVRLSRLFPDAEVWLKLERANPGGSIKDRIALAMVEDAEKKGLLKKGGTIVEPTSGNTGIGLAMVGAVKGYKVIIVMPESMSVERRRVMAVYGAQLELTPKELGINGSIAKAEEIRASIPGAWTPNQFANPANVEVHQSTTAAEVLKDFPEGFDYLITGVGTGGHISGVSEVLKSKMPKLQTYAVEPSKSPVLSGGTHSPHRLQGIGAGIIPENFHRAAVDGFIQVTEEDAFAMTLRAAKEEGIFAGPSTGATLAAIAQKLPDVAKGSRVLGFCYDMGDRYLSFDGLF